jgi:hypothetical protein
MHARILWMIMAGCNNMELFLNNINDNISLSGGLRNIANEREKNVKDNDRGRQEEYATFHYRCGSGAFGSRRANSPLIRLKGAKK